MKSKLNPRRLALTLTLAMVALLSVAVVRAERITKQHTSPLLVTNIGSATGISDVTDATTGVSSTIDLSGGDLDKISWAVYLTSAAGTGTGSVALQISPDGGTTWISNYTFGISTNGLTALSTYYTNQAVNPGTKARFVPTLTAPCTYYGYKIWAMPATN